MFKKWFDRDLAAAKANQAGRMEARSDPDIGLERALRGGRFRPSALEEIITGLIETGNPGQGKLVPAPAELGWLKQTARLL